MFFSRYFSFFLLLLHSMQLLIPPDLAVLYRIWFHLLPATINEERSAASTLADLYQHWILHRGGFRQTPGGRWDSLPALVRPTTRA